MLNQDDYPNTWAAIREGDVDRLHRVIDGAPGVVTS